MSDRPPSFITVAAVAMLFLLPGVVRAAEDQPAKGPRTFIVALDGSGQYRSIQDAVDDAGTGDTVRVMAGEYHEDVTIHSKKRLHLVGEAVDRVKIMGRSRVGSFHIGKWPYGATDVEVSGITINSHGGLAIGIFNGRGIFLRDVRINGLLFGQQVQELRVEHCVIGDSETTGVAFADSQAVLVANLIHHNDHGVTIAGQSDVRLEQNVIHHSLFDGVVVTDRAHAVLVRNTIVKNDVGVSFLGTSRGEASGNVIGLNRIGLVIEPTGQVTLSHNGLFNAEHNYVRRGVPPQPQDLKNVTDLTIDPGFVDPEKDDFRLKADTPLRDIASFAYLGALPPVETR